MEIIETKFNIDDIIASKNTYAIGRINSIYIENNKIIYEIARLGYKEEIEEDDAFLVKNIRNGMKGFEHAD